MPVYEYRCPKCNLEFELLIRMNEKPQCPECGNKKLVRHISAPAGHVTGSSTPCRAHHCDAPAGHCGQEHSASCCCGCHHQH